MLVFAEMKNLMIDTEIEQLSTKPRLLYSDLLKSEYKEVFENIANIINSTNPRQILFHYNNNDFTIPLCNCGEKLSWHPDERQYRKFCSKKCTATFTVLQKKQNNLNSIGVDWHSKTKQWLDQTKQTNLEKYGSEFYTQTLEYKNSVVESNLEKYGVGHIMQVPEINNKVKRTNLERYGVENPLSSEEIKNKIKQTNIERYGVENPLSSEEIKNKIKQTNIERYGVENPSQHNVIQDKILKTKFKNYYSLTQQNALTNTEYLTNVHHDGKPIWVIANELQVNASNLAKIYKKQNINIFRFAKSELETRLSSYYVSLGFKLILNDRNIIPPKELDIVFPDFNLAIEINGCYYHSEKFIQDKNYHLNKTEQCINNNITLLQFWDYELNEKWDQVINFINSHLNMNKRIFARNTKIRILSFEEKNSFIIANHIQGDIPSNINIGIFNEKEILMVATFGKNRYNKRYNYELLRLCSVSGIQVIGGASKLIKYFINHFMNVGETLISYCARRYSTGKVYKAMGFQLNSISTPGFFYINHSGKYAGSRHNWKKHDLERKLVIFDKNKTAKDNMKDNGYQRVWDCGQLVFLITKND